MRRKTPIPASSRGCPPAFSRRAVLGAPLLLASVPARAAAPIRPAIIYDLGTKSDRSFNEGAFTGADRFRRETGIDFVEFEPTNERQFEQAHRLFAERGFDPIVAVGVNQAETATKVARDFPAIRFTLLDGIGHLPNIRSVLFREQEGSFLVGILAVMASRTGRIGFVGGMDIPLIRKFACGFEQGIKYADPRARLIQSMTGTTPGAWNDPGRGVEIAKAQFAEGVDVVFAAAGATGLGVLRAARDAGKLAIGVDSNQNHLYPGTMLTSMVKDIDVAAYQAFKSALDATWRPGVVELGLRDGAVGWSLDAHNASLITPEMKRRADQAKAAIVEGRVDVIDWNRTRSCPL
jgi:basic membrane protein A